MVRHGFARTDGHGSYVGGPRILSLAGRFLARLDLAERVRPVLGDLRERTGAAVCLALRSGDEAVYVATLGHDPTTRTTRTSASAGASHCPARRSAGRSSRP